MRYGYFDDDRREYVITRPDARCRRINYLGTDEHFGTVSNTAGGYSWHLDARLHRLTRYRYNTCPVTPEAATSTCGTTAPASTGRHRGSPPGRRWTPTSAGRAVVHDDQVGQGGISAKTVTRAGRRITRSGGPPSPTSGNHGRAFRFSSVESPLGRTGRRDERPANYSTGEVEVADGVIHHKPSTASAATTSRTSPARAARGLRHTARGIPRPVP